MIRRSLVVAAIALAAVGCGRSHVESSPPPAPAPTPEPAPPAAPPPAPVASEPEPSRITVQHVLIAFRGATRAPQHVTRTKDEARAFANEILERVRKGEDIGKLAQQFSTDPGGGRYTLVNNGVAKTDPTDIPRAQFIRPFTDVAFKLKVGEAGLVEYDPQAASYGWHVIKRLK